MVVNSQERLSRESPPRYMSAADFDKFGVLMCRSVTFRVAWREILLNSASPVGILSGHGQAIRTGA